MYNKPLAYTGIQREKDSNNYRDRVRYKGNQYLSTRVIPLYTKERYQILVHEGKIPNTCTRRKDTKYLYTKERYQILVHEGQIPNTCGFTFTFW